MNETLTLEGWDKWHDWHARLMAPVTDWFREGVSRGERVLDVACGTGLPALALAERVGPGGALVATDVSSEMVAAMKRRAAGLTQVTVREASIDALPFEERSFDVVTCKDGLMYATELVQGARELRRMVRPGGRLLLTAWDEAERCAFFRTLFQGVGPFLPAPPPPDAPGPLRLSKPGRLEEVLGAAGFTEVQLERREVVFAFDSLEQHWDVVRDLAGPVTMLATKSPHEVPKLRARFAELLAPFMSGSAVKLPCVALCVRARA